MIRATLVTLFTFVVQLFFAAIALSIGTTYLVFIIPATLILVANEFSRLEAVLSLLVIGLFLDTWIGAPIGVAMSVLVFLYVSAFASIKWIGKPDYFIRTAFIFLFSLAFRLSMTLALGIVGGTLGNWDGLAIVLMPFLDAAIGTKFYSLNLRIFPALGLSDIREDTSQILSRRTTQASLE